MKKLIIGALVTAIILFFWQFASWSFLGIHNAEMAYSENQAEIMECLDGKLEHGTYFMPRLTDDATSDEQNAHMEAMIGNPWAVVSYRPAFTNDGAMNMLRGFLANFVAALILCWLLLKIPNLDLKDTVISSIAVGLLGYIAYSYLGSIWFETSSIGHLFDAIVSFGLAGLWLGWWLNRGKE